MLKGGVAVRNALCIGVIVMLAALANYAFAGGSESVVGQLISKVFSTSLQESRDAERQLLEGSSPASVAEVRREIESGCIQGEYEKVQKLAKIRKKMQERTGPVSVRFGPSGVKGEVFIEGKPEGDLDKPKPVGDFAKGKE